MAIAVDYLKIYVGDTATIQITVTDYDGDAFDLTSFTAVFTAKEGDEDPVISVEEACDTDPTTGIETLTLASTDTAIDVGKYDYDIKVYNADDPKIVHTVAKGKLQILADINPDY